MFNTCIRHKRIKGQYRHVHNVVVEIMTVDTETNIGLKDKVYNLYSLLQTKIWYL